MMGFKKEKNYWDTSDQSFWKIIQIECVMFNMEKANHIENANGMSLCLVSNKGDS